MARPPKQPDGTDHFEIQTDESTMGRFADLTRRLLTVSHDEIRKREQEFKANQRKRKEAKRRICFDIASNYYLGLGWLEGPAEAREHWRGRSFTFHAATAFDDASQRYSNFTDCNELFAYLAGADEIISFNGRKCDLIVLEHLVGEEAVGALWRKPHYDLTGWRGRWSLRDAIADLPVLASSFETVRVERLAEIGGSYTNDFVAGHLADTYRDVKFTYELFQRYVASGDSDCTYRDLI